MYTELLERLEFLSMYSKQRALQQKMQKRVSRGDNMAGLHDLQTQIEGVVQGYR